MIAVYGVAQGVCYFHVQGFPEQATLGNPTITPLARAPISEMAAPIPCTHLCPDTKKDSCPIVSETMHVTFANDRLSSPVSPRSER